MKKVACAIAGALAFAASSLSAAPSPAALPMADAASAAQMEFDGFADLYATRNSYYLIGFEAHAGYGSEYAAGQPETGYAWAMADYNGDNIPDLYGAGGYDARFTILDGASGFRQSLYGTAWYPGSGMGWGYENLAADWDGDGRGDWYSFYQQGSSTAVQVSTASSNFLQGLPTTAMPSVPYNSQVSFGLGDYDGDKRFDVYAIRPNGTGGAKLTILSAASNFQTTLLQKDIAFDAASVYETVGDYDGDGRSDLITSKPTSTGQSTVNVYLAGAGFVDPALSRTVAGTYLMAPGMTRPEDEADEGAVDPYDQDVNNEVLDPKLYPGQRVEVLSRASGGSTSLAQVAADEIPFNGWSACGNFDGRSHLVKAYDRLKWHDRMVGTYASLRCGIAERDGTTSAYGFRHIEFRHGPPTAQGSKWSTLSAKIGREWRDLAAWALDATADDPDTVVKAGDKRFCMDRMFGFGVDDEITERWRAVLILGKTGRRIMNLIPAKSSLSSDSGYQCRKADTLPSDIIFAQMPRV